MSPIVWLISRRAFAKWLLVAVAITAVAMVAYVFTERSSLATDGSLTVKLMGVELLLPGMLLVVLAWVALTKVPPEDRLVWRLIPLGVLFLVLGDAVGVYWRLGVLPVNGTTTAVETILSFIGGGLGLVATWAMVGGVQVSRRRTWGYIQDLFIIFLVMYVILFAAVTPWMSADDLPGVTRYVRVIAYPSMAFTAVLYDLIFKRTMWRTWIGRKFHRTSIIRQ